MLDLFSGQRGDPFSIFSDFKILVSNVDTISSRFYAQKNVKFQQIFING